MAGSDKLGTVIFRSFAVQLVVKLGQNYEIHYNYNNGSIVKVINILIEIWRYYKHFSMGTDSICHCFPAQQPITM